MQKIFFAVFLAAFVFAATPVFSATPEEILAEMSLEEKVGQVIVGAFVGDSMSHELRFSLQNLHFGGIIFFSAAGNIKSVEQVRSLIDEMQKTAKGRAPLFISIDQEGGRVARIRDGVTVWPGNMALGATQNLNFALRQAEIMAQELRVLGFNMNLAPVADVNSNPKNPIIGVRSFGSDPVNVSAFVCAMLDGFEKGGIISTVKHFPGHGDTATDSHYELPRIDKTLAELEAVELVPFRAAIARGVRCIMTSHIIVPALGAKDVPITLSKEALGYLREKMGYQGLILTDALIGMKAIEDNWGTVEAGVMALNAGADLLVYGLRVGELDKIFPVQKAAHARIVAAVKGGELPIERLDESVLRILRHKENISTEKFGEISDLAKPSSVALAEEISLAAVTLVRDEKNLIPARAKNAPIVIMMSSSAEKGGIKEILQAADQSNVIYVALGSPYDILSFPNIGTYIATYSDSPASISAASKVIFGEEQAKGKLPIDLK